MSFLAPLYLIAGLAIGLPILFHLIRQTPKGKQVFSSIMFLSPSPPRMTKRSHVEDWLLLLLRAFAICLLALAFARPFFRTTSSDDAPTGIVLLIDTSASMQRKGYWESVQAEVNAKLKEVSPEDSLAVLRFDSDTEMLFSIEEWKQQPQQLRKERILERVRNIDVSWNKTRLGEAMIQAAELLTENNQKTTQALRLIVISDLQSGSEWEALSAYTWPQNVLVDFVPVGERGSATNASIQIVADDNLTDNILRLRVSNSQDAGSDLFNINWQDLFSDGVALPKSNSDISAYVPPGQTRIVRAPDPPTDFITQRLVLTGDEEPFDNICYVAKTEPWKVHIVYAGNTDDSTNGLRFFLEPVFQSTPGRKVTVHNWNSEDVNSPIEATQLSLMVIGGKLSTEQLSWVREWSRAGGQTLFVATDPEQSLSLYELLELPISEVTEADITEYSMLSQVDLTHPIFAQFDDPRFSDFTKLRYWKHRVFKTESLPDLKVLAKLENNDPAIGEIPIGKGRVILLSSGWNRDDSDLAVWSKFVPMMNAMLEYGSQQRYVRPQFTVGDVIHVSDFSRTETQLKIRHPKGEIVPFNDTYRFMQPGLYKIAPSELELAEPNATTLAVNLPPAESQTTPLSLDVFKSNGIPLSLPKQAQATELNEAVNERQLMNVELESKQQLWKWLLLLALFVLFLETVIAGIRAPSRQAV